MGRAGFAYAHARMQSRFAERLTDSNWRFIETSRNFEHCLESLRRVSKIGIGQKLAHQTDVHVVEQVLGDSLTNQLREATGWLPEAWQAAARWFATLPFLRHMGKGRDGKGPEAPDEIRWLSTMPEFSDPVFASRYAAANWRRTWEEALPRTHHAEEVRSALRPFLDRFLGPDVPPTATDWSRLEASVSKTFRNHAQSPVSAFAFLALLILDHERLRGVLVARVLFPEDA